MRAVVMCRVSGGVTGTREALLKGKDGEVQYFESFEVAQAEARRLMESANGDRYRTATFQYWAEVL
jgi:hypothetical protein